MKVSQFFKSRILKGWHHHPLRKHVHTFVCLFIAFHSNICFRAEYEDNSLHASSSITYDVLRDSGSDFAVF